MTAKAMKAEGNLVKKGKLHKLALGCDSDYDGAQLWINLSAPYTHTHTTYTRHTHRANTTSVIVSDGQKSFQSGDPVIPHSPGLRPSSRLGSSRTSTLPNGPLITTYVTLTLTLTRNITFMLRKQSGRLYRFCV